MGIDTSKRVNTNIFKPITSAEKLVAEKKTLIGFINCIYCRLIGGRPSSNEHESRTVKDLVQYPSPVGAVITAGDQTSSTSK